MVEFLENKTVLITGSGRGIGKALALGFSGMGANIILTARNSEEINLVKNEIESQGNRAIAVSADIQDYESVKTVVESGIQEFGKIDALINNAGYSKIKPITRLRVSEFQDMIKTNIMGVYNATHLVVPYMIEKKNGSIVNTGSVAINLAMPSWSAYAMTKSALVSFTTCLAEELKRDKIRVNTIMPNMVHTPMLHAGRTPEQIETLDAIEPKELVPYYAFLIADESKKITGMNISVDAIKQVLSLKQELPEAERENANWSSVESLAENKLKSEDFKMARKCKKLVSYLLQY